MQSGSNTIDVSIEHRPKRSRAELRWNDPTQVAPRADRVSGDLTAHSSLKTASLRQAARHGVSASRANLRYQHTWTCLRDRNPAELAIQEVVTRPANLRDRSGKAGHGPFRRAVERAAIETSDA